MSRPCRRGEKRRDSHLQPGAADADCPARAPGSSGTRRRARRPRPPRSRGSGPCIRCAGQWLPMCDDASHEHGASRPLRMGDRSAGWGGAHDRTYSARSARARLATRNATTVARARAAASALRRRAAAARAERDRSRVGGRRPAGDRQWRHDLHARGARRGDARRRASARLRDAAGQGPRLALAPDGAAFVLVPHDASRGGGSASVLRIDGDRVTPIATLDASPTAMAATRRHLAIAEPGTAAGAPQLLDLRRRTVVRREPLTTARVWLRAGSGDELLIVEPSGRMRRVDAAARADDCRQSGGDQPARSSAPASCPASGRTRAIDHAATSAGRRRVGRTAGGAGARLRDATPTASACPAATAITAAASSPPWWAAWSSSPTSASPRIRAAPRASTGRRRASPHAQHGGSDVARRPTRRDPRRPHAAPAARAPRRTPPHDDARGARRGPCVPARRRRRADLARRHAARADAGRAWPRARSSRSAPAPLSMTARRSRTSTTSPARNSARDGC